MHIDKPKINYIRTFGWKDLPTGIAMLDAMQTIDGWLHPAEIAAIQFFATRALRKHPELPLVEIGSYQGRSTVAIGLCCKSEKHGTLIAIDPHTKSLEHLYIKGDSFSILKHHLRLFHVSQYVTIERTTSAKSFAHHKTLRTSFVFIDGDHELSSVQQDCSLWGSTLENGGYLLLHDTLNLYGPGYVFFSLLLHPKYSYIETVGDLAIFIKSSHISMKQWIKKLGSYIVFKMFFRIYTSQYNMNHYLYYE